MEKEFNFREKVIRDFKNQTTFSSGELDTIFTILGIRFDEFIKKLKEKSDDPEFLKKFYDLDPESCGAIMGLYMKEIDKLAG